MEVGQIVGRRYAVEAVAGKGGMCSVYRARDLGDRNQLVAIKALHQRAVDAEERFSREVSMLKDLAHPAVVRYLDSGSTDAGQRFLVMEWLDGSDLEALLRKRPLTIGEVLTLTSRVGHALGAAHSRGIVHRDVKPSNIFIVGDDVRQAKLLDFGVARWGQNRRVLTVTGASVGTPAYMSPEQVRGEKNIDARADVFALGCVMYECLTGDPAFVAHNPMAVFCKILVEKAPSAVEMLPGLPDIVDQLLGSMLAKDANDRPRDGNAVALAIDALAARMDATTQNRRAPPSQARSGETITGDEQRLVNVIVAAPGTAGAGDVGEAHTLRLLPSRLPSFEFAPAQRVSVRFDALSDGSLVALLDSHGVATDQAMNAARFALALREEFPHSDLALATGLAETGRPKLVGEAIDRACQLLSRTLPRPETPGGRPHPIRVDDVTAGLISTRFDVLFEESGPLLAGERPAAAERTLLGRPTPFVGRARELGILTASVDECIENHVARVVLVTGAAGSGKSRLLRELLRHVETRPGERMEVWTAAGDPMRSGTPQGMMSEAVRRLAGVLDGEAPSLRRQKLRTLVSRHVAPAQASRVSEFLGELIRADTTEDSVPLRAARQDPILMGDQVRRALEDLLDAHCAARPVMLVLEDMHWGDQATATLVDRALRLLAERRLFVLVLARPEVYESFPRLFDGHGVTELRLGALPRRAAQSLAEAVLGSTVSRERVVEIVDRADGNPFYLEELLRSAAGGVDVLPETVVAMLQARIEALEPEARRVLRAASVFGATMWRGGVQALTGEAGPLLDHWLDILVQRELISVADDSRFSRERAYRFRHQIVRDAAYALLTRDDRRLGHRLAGQWLERAGETDSRALAEHFQRGDDLPRALPLYLRAAETALERGDFAAVLDLVGRAEACGPQPDDVATRGLLRALQGDAHFWRGEHGEAVRRFVEAMDLLPRGSQHWHQAASHLGVIWGTDAVDRAADLGRELLAEQLPDGQDRVTGLMARTSLGGRLILTGHHELGRALMASAEAIAAEIGAGDALSVAHLHRARAICALIDGNPAAFLRELELGAARFEEIGAAREVCFHHANIGYAKLELGLFADAEGELRASIATATGMGLDHVAWGARANLGIALARQPGQPEKRREALALEQRAAEWYEQQGTRRFAGLSRTYLAEVLLREGDAARAEAEARAALGSLDSASSALTLATLARILLSRDAAAEALEHATAARRELDARSIIEGDATVRLVYAEALHACGDLSGARDAIASACARLLERAERIGEPYRESYLHVIADHARTLTLARDWIA